MSISHPTRAARGLLSALDALSPGCGLGLPPRGGRPSLTPAPGLLSSTAETCLFREGSL